MILFNKKSVIGSRKMPFNYNAGSAICIICIYANFISLKVHLRCFNIMNILVFSMWGWKAIIPGPFGIVIVNFPRCIHHPFYAISTSH